VEDRLPVRLGVSKRRVCRPIVHSRVLSPARKRALCIPDPWHSQTSRRDLLRKDRLKWRATAGAHRNASG
jgi:hypothetical protein